MKKVLFLLVCVSLVFASCNSITESTEVTTVTLDSVNDTTIVVIDSIVCDTIAIDTI